MIVGSALEECIEQYTLLNALDKMWVIGRYQHAAVAGVFEGSGPPLKIEQRH